jgi:adenosylmethionine-8-amino-7-oxononanoate aminotransferase
MRTCPPSPVIVRGDGALLFDEEGRSYLDAISSWWVNLHGHAPPTLVKTLAEQASRFSQLLFADFTHEPAVELAERLLRLIPGGHAKVFFSDDGSTAVEAALKMALQYFVNRGEDRTTIVALDGAYHGDTFGAMSVSGRSGFTEPYRKLLFNVEHLPFPSDPEREHEALHRLEEILATRSPAAFIYEPLVQGAAGMRMYREEFLDQALRLCTNAGVLTIADEVMTGFGRTGPLFASELPDTKPDIVCLSKGITGGLLPLGVTSCRQQVFDAFLAQERSKMFFHGHSFTGNALSCAVAVANVDLLLDPACTAARARIRAQHTTFLDTLRSTHDFVENPRVRGTILAFDIKNAEGTSYFNTLRDRLAQGFMSRGVLLRPLGNVIYVLPPYCITETQLETVYRVIHEVLEEVTGSTPA